MIKIAQIIGLLAVSAFALSLHQKNKEKILWFRVISNIFYTLEYLLLKAFSAVGTNIVDVIQTVVFYKYTKNDEKIPLYCVLSYTVIITIIGFFTYQNIISLIPIVLSIIGAYSIWQNNLRVTRLISLFIIILWMIYNFLVQAYVNAFGNIFQFIMGVIAVYRFEDIKLINNTVEKIKNKIKKT